MNRHLFWWLACALVLLGGALTASRPARVVIAEAARLPNQAASTTTAPGKVVSKSLPSEPKVAADAVFTDVSAALPNLVGLMQGAASWADIDGDGKLDLFVDGSIDPESLSKLYLNTSTAGNPSFSDATASIPQLPGLEFGAAAWADFDSDGRLDLFLDGTTTGGAAFTALYRNTSTPGAPSFVDVTSSLPALTSMDKGTAGWADVDNDGKVDLLAEGDIADNGLYVKLWRNTSTPGRAAFVDATSFIHPAAALGWTSIAWGDYDSDGRTDLYLQGRDSPSPYKAANQRANQHTQGRDAAADTASTRLYHNTSLPGVPSLTDVSSTSDTGLVILYGGTAIWGDADNDGKLDLFADGNLGETFLFRNVTTGTRASFVRTAALPADQPGFWYSQSSWGDYDNDGRLDLLATGWNPGVGSKLYRNTSTLDSLSFIDTTSSIPALPAVERAAVSWGDFDNDGKLDLYIDGYDYDNSPSGVSKLYRNIGAVADTPPTAPSALTAVVNGTSSVMLTWSAASDAQTPAAGLSYNLRVGTTPGGEDIFSSMAAANGWRRIPARGPIQGTSYFLNNLPPGTIYWSVQAIDTAFAGGAFASEQQFLVAGATYTPQPTLTSTATSTPTTTATSTNTGTATITPTPTATPFPFSDVTAADFFFAPVQYLAVRGVISGYETTPPCSAGQSPCFLPFNQTTRAQVVKIVVLAEGLPITVPPTPTFSDVAANDVFYPYIETAYSRQIVSGYSCGARCLEFRPGNHVTRAQLAKIVVLAAGWPLVTPAQRDFYDVPRADPFYSFIETACGHHVLAGYTDYTFRPGANATRGQIAKIVYLAVTQP